MNKSVLITGASRGLGLALTKVYLERNFSVYACCRNVITEEFENLKKENINRLHTIYMDISDDNSVVEAASKLKEMTTELDIIINNGAIHFNDSLNNLEDVNFECALATYNVNTLGALRVTKGFLSFLNNSEKKVIANISSEAGSIGACWRDKEFDYCMSKAALNMQSVLLQRYLESRRIRVLAIHPGWMRTDMGGEAASFDPMESARAVFGLIDKYGDNYEVPLFMDYEGKTLKW